MKPRNQATKSFMLFVVRARLRRREEILQSAKYIMM
jgi:hypothetical protein